MSDYDEPPDIDVDDMIDDAENFDKGKYAVSGLNQSCQTWALSALASVVRSACVVCLMRICVGSGAFFIALIVLSYNTSYFRSQTHCRLSVLVSVLRPTRVYYSAHTFTDMNRLLPSSFSSPLTSFSYFPQMKSNSTWKSSRRSSTNSYLKMDSTGRTTRS